MLDDRRSGRGQERPDRRRLHDLRRHLDRDGHRLQEARRKDIYACVSHGVFSRGSAAKIEQSPIKELVLTDTIEYRFEPLPPCCKIVSVASSSPTPSSRSIAARASAGFQLLILERPGAADTEARRGSVLTEHLTTSGKARRACPLPAVSRFQSSATSSIAAAHTA